MTSNYASDPRVPPARVEHLGPHRKSVRQRTGLPRAHTPREFVVDDGPTYEDFLDDLAASDADSSQEVTDKTG